MSKLTLAYWDIRGLTEAIRYLLYYAEVDFEDKRYNIGPPPEFERPEWLSDKFNLGLDFPNLPYLIDGDVKISQSTAIIRYLARKLKLGAENEEEQIRLDVAEQQFVDLRVAVSKLCYSPDFEKLKAEHLTNLPAQLELVVKFLGDRKYVLGDRITYVDFILYEALDFNRMLDPACLDKFDTLKQFMERIEGLPGVSKYMKSDKYHKLPIVGPMATWGGKRE